MRSTIRKMLLVLAALAPGGVATSGSSDAIERGRAVTAASPREARSAPSAATVAALEAIHPAWRDFEPKFVEEACPFEGEYDPDIITCGYVKVPEDRTDPDSSLIRIALMRIAPGEGAPEGNAIVRLMGGPGIPSLQPERAAYFSDERGTSLRSLGELIYFDQRGVGVSERAFCRGIPQFFQRGPIPSDEGQRQSDAAMKACIAEAKSEGIAAGAYNNWSNALDVRDLRRALGYRQWNLLGVSYGTHLGQGVMTVDPEGVRAAVLDSVVPSVGRPTLTGSTGRNFEQSLAAVEAACDADPDCAAAYPELAERIYRVIEGFGENPMVLDGLKPPAFPERAALLDSSTVAQLLFQLLYRNDIYGDLPIVLEALETRNAPALRVYAQSGAPGYDRHYGSGMNMIIGCSDGHAIDDRAQRELDEAAPRSEPWFSAAGPGRCTADIDLTPDLTAVPLRSSIPTLVAAGDADPITPWQEGEAIMDGLPNATFVRFPHTGHGAIFSPGTCGEQILRDFILDPESAIDTSCAADTPPPNFATDWRSTGKPFQLVTATREGQWPLGLILALVGVVGAVFFFPAAAVGRRVEARRGRTVSGGLARARWASWGGAALALGGAVAAALIVRGWMAAHPVGLPVGVPTSVALAGWLVVVAAVLALLGAVLAWRARASAPTGTLVATWVTVVATLGLLVAMTAHGLGPIAV